MSEDYCCGGGHCGELPGYTFQCPSCNSESFCRTGKPLKASQTFKCLKCKQVFSVLSIKDSSFSVEICATKDQALN